MGIEIINLHPFFRFFRRLLHWSNWKNAPRRCSPSRRSSVKWMKPTVMRWATGFWHGNASFFFAFSLAHRSIENLCQLTTASVVILIWFSEKEKVCLSKASTSISGVFDPKEFFENGTFPKRSMQAFFRQVPRVLGPLGGKTGCFER